MAGLTVAAMAVGATVDGFAALLWAGTGVTAYGAAYLFVHDLYIHRRVARFTWTWGPLERVREAHRIHHLFGGEPYGFLFPIVPSELRSRARTTTRDPLLPSPARSLAAMTAQLGELATWGAVVALVAAAVLAAAAVDPGRRHRASHRRRAGGRRRRVPGVGAGHRRLHPRLRRGDDRPGVVVALPTGRAVGRHGGVAAAVGGHGRGLGRAPPVGRRSSGPSSLRWPAPSSPSDALLASPWDRLASPALDGEGLTPILEHPAMLIHPPLLYAGLTGLVVPFALTVGAAALDDAWAARVRRQLLACVVALTAGMAIGAHWAYAEVGWGGFWAWDPSRTPPCCRGWRPWPRCTCLRSPAPPAARRPPRAAPSCSALLGAVLDPLRRDGIGPRVRRGRRHRPRPHRRRHGRRRRRRPPAPRRPRTLPRERSPRRTDLAAAFGAGRRSFVVLVGTVRPLVGDAAVAVDGSYYARLVGPVAVVAAAVLVADRVVATGRGAVAHRLPRAARRRAGLDGGRVDRRPRSDAARSVEVGGWEVRNDGVARRRRPHGCRRRHPRCAVATFGPTSRPSLVAHPERGGLLAETSLRSTPLTDVLVALRGADDDGRALLEVHVRPLVWWVWWGAALVALGALRARYTTAAEGGGAEVDELDALRLVERGVGRRQRPVRLRLGRRPTGCGARR